MLHSCFSINLLQQFDLFIDTDSCPQECFLFGALGNGRADTAENTQEPTESSVLLRRRNHPVSQLWMGTETKRSKKRFGTTWLVFCWLIVPVLLLRRKTPFFVFVVTFSPLVGYPSCLEVPANNSLSHSAPLLSLLSCTHSITPSLTHAHTGSVRNTA